MPDEQHFDGALPYTKKQDAIVAGPQAELGTRGLELNDVARAGV
jgi:hypothetical protein